ncbi:MAG: hypothetical protein JWR66_1615 [Modestobacter sp.]|nr:hypothetical protein [Modestobacter sp.]
MRSVVHGRAARPGLRTYRRDMSETGAPAENVLVTAG